MNQKIFGQVGRLKSGKVEEYINLHKEVWPDVLKVIKKCNLQNYSIFIKDNIVFAYFEYTGSNYEEDMKYMEKDAVTQKWWSYTKPCFQFYSDNSSVKFYENMEAIFYME